MQHIPLSLYIHIPWCVRKCPYCDFNSHRAGSSIPEKEYIKQLINDLEQDLPKIWGREIQTIFIGGGTPSLFSPSAIEELLKQLHARLAWQPNIEITMEANPGTVEQKKFIGFKAAGINRLSMGIQSFQDDKLQALGRIHNAAEAKQAIIAAKKAGFDNFNLDLMHGLPKQSAEDALHDLQTAIEFFPTHISWYQLTLEPNTVFAKHPPILPQEEKLWNIQQLGEQLLLKNHYQQYEVSAYAKDKHYCQHNLNYWQFGDYLGIGAGAHAKITNFSTNQITRYSKIRNPRDYLACKENFIATKEEIASSELPLEFMMNALRLTHGVPTEFFEQRTGMSLSKIEDSLKVLREKGLLENNPDILQTTELGRRFLNECLLEVRAES